MRRRASQLIGKKVRSHFRARWTGTVLRESDIEDCVFVKVEIDRCGNPIRKPIIKHLNIHWLEVLP